MTALRGLFASAAVHKAPPHPGGGMAAGPHPRVLQLGTGWFPERKGGAESHFYNLLPQLRRHGFEVHGVVPGSPRVQQDTAGAVRSYDPAGLSQLRRAQAIRRAASPLLSSTDVIGAHFALYALPLLDRLARQPFVQHFHGPWALESLAEGGGAAAARAKGMIERIVYRRADRVIVHTDAFGDILRSQYGIPGDRIRRVPGGVECDRFATGLSRAAARLQLGWERDRPVLVTVRRLVRRMGVGNLIQAMAKLPRTGQDTVLYVVGAGPERAALQALAADLGLHGRVRFTGPLPDADLPLAYRAADLTVVPSIALEGFGLIAAESLAAGTPVLVTPVGGLPEVVSGLSTALLLPGKEPAAIARGIADALADPARLPDAQACSAYARAHFDWNAVGSQLAAVYREVL